MLARIKRQAGFGFYGSAAAALHLVKFNLAASQLAQVMQASGTVHLMRFCGAFHAYRTAQPATLLTSSDGKKRTRKSVKAMLPSMMEMGTGRSLGCLPSNLKRYSPCSRALHALPGPAPIISHHVSAPCCCMVQPELGSLADWVRWPVAC